MNTPAYYEIRIQGEIGERWSEWFEGLAIEVEPGGSTRLCGELPDQAALFGVLNKIHALNLTLIVVERLNLDAFAA